ncbi:hypothetical protein SDC9_143368 [bioreactor metagenome]|uniref:Uncharacterized protein n=1 Tax=bioreactor metagenome TaxID=1076179 RepID=A0A645E367_9ZZZZ
MLEVENRHIPSRFQPPGAQQCVEVRERQVVAFKHQRRLRIDRGQEPGLEFTEKRLCGRLEQERFDFEPRTGFRAPRHRKRTLHRITVHSGKKQFPFPFRGDRFERRIQGAPFIDVDARMTPGQKTQRTFLFRRKDQQITHLLGVQVTHQFSGFIVRSEDLAVDQETVDSGVVDQVGQVLPAGGAGKRGHQDQSGFRRVDRLHRPLLDRRIIAPQRRRRRKDAEPPQCGSVLRRRRRRRVDKNPFPPAPFAAQQPLVRQQRNRLPDGHAADFKKFAQLRITRQFVPGPVDAAPNPLPQNPGDVPVFDGI